MVPTSAGNNVTELENVRTLENRVSKLAVKRKRLVATLVKNSAMPPDPAVKTSLVRT